ncbi:MAG TPA: GNAT family N-acetyltransferase [Gemmatimonadaceae bacterium]|nr:GNAT family N-acetyltransferase [Gemmatimonadaceae bacterium]
MTGEPRLRLATPADVPAITALIRDSVRGLSDGLYSDAEIEESLVTVFGVDSQLLADGTYFVIEDDIGLAASGGWSRRATVYGGDQAKREPDVPLDPARDAARIRAFYVSPRCARRGLARRLYQACESAAVAAGFTRFLLGSTLPGIPLYESLGFHQLERADYPMRFGLSLGIMRMERTIP